VARLLTEIVFPFNNVGTLERTRSVVLRQRYFEHDLLIAEVYGYRGRSLDLRAGDPVRASLVTNGVTIPFVGYVHHVAPTLKTGANVTPDHKIVMMGASLPMKNATQRIWRDVTVSEMATQIAAKYKLTADIERSARRIPMVNQAGLSDWAFLVKQAKRLGWVFYVNGTILSFHSRGLKEVRRKQSAPRLEYRIGNDFLQTDVRSFEPNLGESLPNSDGMKSRRSMRGVDPRSAAIISAHHDGSVRSGSRKEKPVGRFSTFAVGGVVNSGGEAVAQATGAADANRFAYRATARTVGIPGVTQGSLIFFSNLPGDFDGYWTVLAVEHRYQGQYEMVMELGTDSIGLRNDATQPGLRPIVIDAYGTAVAQLPQSSVLRAPAGDLRSMVLASRGDADAATSVLSLNGFGGMGVAANNVSPGTGLVGGSSYNNPPRDPATGEFLGDGGLGFSVLPGLSNQGLRSGALGASAFVSTLTSSIPFEGPIGSPTADALSADPQVFRWQGSISTLLPTGTEIQSPNFGRGPYVRRHNGR